MIFRVSFDNLDHELALETVRKHTNYRWILLYIDRWLKAPIQMEDGTLVQRASGSLQGSVISPLISNIFLHLAFDEWMGTRFADLPFERFADDGIVHSWTEKQAKYVLEMIAERLNQWKLKLHPEKTRIVYCKGESRKGNYKHERFDFLGYTFRPRTARTREGRLFESFSPAISDRAAKNIREMIRGWRLHRWSSQPLSDLARFCNQKLRGWINYYGRFYKSAIGAAVRSIDIYLVRWARGKFKRLRKSSNRAWQWWEHVRNQAPTLIAHWNISKRSTGRVMGAGRVERFMSSFERGRG